VTSNLTRDEAAARSALIAVASYHVDLDLTGSDEVFDSVCVVRFDCNAPGSASFINLTAPAVREITLNGEPVRPGAFDGDRITLEGLAASPASVIRSPSKASRPTGSPLRVISRTAGAVKLMKLVEPGAAQPNLITQTERNTSSPPVRSRST